MFGRKKQKQVTKNLKSESDVLLKKKTPLTKEEKHTLQARMAEIRKYKSDNSTVQNTIDYIEMYKDGVCKISKNQYSKTVQFYDANYGLADFEEQNNIFNKYCTLLNIFDSTTPFQLTFENQNRSQDKIIEEIKIPPQDDDFNELRQEYSDMLVNNLTRGSNGQSTRKFLTFCVEANSYKDARAKLFSLQTEIVKLFKNFGVDAKGLNGEERLEAMYYSLNPFETRPFIFSWKAVNEGGMSTKDFISPTSLVFKKYNFEVGHHMGQCLGFDIVADEIPDTVLTDILKLQNLYLINIHVKVFEKLNAKKFLSQKLANIESMKIDEQKKASRNGYDVDMLPVALQQNEDNVKQTIKKMNDGSENLFYVSIIARDYAKNKKELAMQIDLLKRTCQTNNCRIFPFDYMQEELLNSSLPLGKNLCPTKRVLLTSPTAAFIPFISKELFQPGDNAAYYGLNAISNTMIIVDRSKLKNPNGLILGTPGSGKSFSAKREMLNAFLTSSDDIIICDPEGEYFPLVNALKGQVIKISSSSEQYVNPMEINIDSNMDENPISMKADFIMSLCELIVAGKYGLSSVEKSLIDRCVRNIYNEFFKHPSKENMPTLSDLYQALLACGEPAMRVAASLEMYVNGSQNLFNHQTNINLDNRVICFDIKELGNQLKKLGMLIVQDTVWNRVTINRAERKTTRYYMDEFHLLISEEQTARYSAEIWKRFRKWGGIPTGITQNVKDLLTSKEVENIFDNSDFIYLLNQAPGDRDILSQKLHISRELQEYITNSGAGEGLISYGGNILPFVDKFPTDTEMYKLLTTKPKEQQLTT